MKRADPFAAYFRLQPSVGEDSRIIFVSEEKQGEIHFIREHAQWDGTSGLVDCLREDGVSSPELEAPRHPPRPFSWTAGAREFFRFQARVPYPDPGFPRREKQPQSVEFKFFSEEQSRNIFERGRNEKISLNGLLLQELVKVTHPLSDGKSPQIWSIPVSLRGHGEGIPLGNEISFFDAALPSSADAREIDRIFLAALQDKTYWGFFCATRIAQLFGQKAFLKLIPDIHRDTPRMGIFSNLGRWSGDAPWGFAPPALSHMPISVGVLTRGARLTLGMRRHGRLGVQAQEVLDDWVRRIHS
jgi:hypothetical protein